MTDKGTGGSPETGSSPYDEPTLQMRRTRSSRLETEDDLDFDGSSVGGGAHAAPTEQMYRPDTTGAHTPDSFGPATGVDQRAPKARRGTLDLGLLILRLVVGATLIAHGLQKLVGLWGGPGLDGFEQLLREAGYQQPRILAIAGAVGETAAGALLVLGLLTPLAAAAVVAIMINAVLYKHNLEPGVQYFASERSGFEYEVLLAATAVALTLTGPGRIAADGPRKWATRPFLGSFVALLLGVAAGVCLWLFAR
ncbi:DoxX family protein [Rhodococcus coprophilus]|nr:DoxX family protein [Rhodococcus coprophilus]MBM7460269.1 putative oxidoreductase [Rhodococcus coprophilus]